MAGQALPTYTSLDQLVELIEGREPVFVRWSRGPQVDLRAPGSRDELTGAEMPGLSANPLGTEGWGEELPMTLRVARRLYDYSHLRDDRGSGVRPWVLTAEEVGRGPDNEPLVHRVKPIAWIADSVIAEAESEVARQAGAWGPMRRPPRFSDRSGRPPRDR